MKFLRFFFLVLILLFGPLAILAIRSQGMTHLNWLIPAAVLLWIFLFGFWYLCFGRKPFLRRLLHFGIGLAAFFGLGFALSKMVRYEGSASGSSYPKVSWVWEEKETTEPAERFSAIEPGADEVPERLAEAAGELECFLGPDRDGTWESAPFATDWNASPPELLWRRPVGKAWSSFVVADGKAITQEQAGDAERVTCLDLFTGKELWHHSDPGVGLLLFRAENEGAAMGGDGPRSTPTIHAGKVYSLGATGVVNCLDLSTGERLWTRNSISEFDGEVQRWGNANAPLILPEQGAVVVAGTDKPGINLIALSLDEGETIWTYQGRGASYSSPRVLNFFGVSQIVSVNAKDVSGIDPATGLELWTHSWPGNYPKVAQPMKVDENRLLLTASYGAGSPLIELSRHGETWQASEVWKTIRMKTKFSSAVIRGGYAYGLDEGRLACIDLQDGDKEWKNQKYGFGQQLMFGEHLLIQTEPGSVVVGRVSPESFEETGSIDALSSMTWNAPAVAGRLLLVRNDREAACYLLPAP